MPTKQALATKRTSTPTHPTTIAAPTAASSSTPAAELTSAPATPPTSAPATPPTSAPTPAPKRYHAATNCPITATIDVIGGKWKPIILYLLLDGPLRFGELHRIVPGMALKVLSRQLKELESDGLLIRTAYPEVPPRVVYALSPKGETLRPVLRLLSAWSSEHILHSV